MALRTADVQVRWILDLVDKATKPMLTADRSVRRSLEETDRVTKRAAQTTQRSAQQMAMAASRSARGFEGEGRAAQHTAVELHELSSAQEAALRAGNRAIAMQARQVTAYERTARAVKDSTRAQELSARAQSKLSGPGVSSLNTKIGRGGAALGGAAVAGAFGVTKAVEMFAGFEQQMDKVQAVAGATGKQMAAMNAQAKQLGADTAFSAKEAADGMYQLSTAGFTANQTMKIIPGTLALASASGIDLASAAELQASTLRGFGLAAGDAGKVADALATTVNHSAVEMSDLYDSLKYVAPVAKATGQSMNGMLAAMGLMGNVGIKGSQAGTTLRTALVRLTDPTEKATGALSQLHIKTQDLQGPNGLKPLPVILGKIVRGSQGMDKSTRNAALSAIFGREALSGMVSMVEKGPKAFRRNIKALEDSKGAAKESAKIMRGNIAGAWDQFTGSVETAAITLTERFGPAIRKGLKGAASGVNTLAKGGSELLKGLSSGTAEPTRTVRRDAGGRVTGVDVKQASTATKIGASIRQTFEKIAPVVKNVMITVGSALMTAGKQLFEAFKPAMPFIQNVLLPLLKGIAEGVIGGVVAAFKVLVPIIRVVSEALGFIGKAAAPLKGVFEGIGKVIGFVFAGPILKGIGLLGKLGGVFGLVGKAAKVFAAPIDILGGLLKGLFSIVPKLAGVFGKVGGVILGAGKMVAKLPLLIAKLDVKILTAAGKLVLALVKGLAAIPGKMASIAAKGITALAKGIIKLAGKVPGIIGALATALFGLGAKIIDKIVGGITSAPGKVIDAIKGLFTKTVDINIVGKIQGTIANPEAVFTGNPHDLSGGRRGYRAGGPTPIMAAGGEMLVWGNKAAMIPGDPGRDGTMIMAPAGSAVITGHGQGLMAAGASVAEALRYQAPHFAKGGKVGGLLGGAFHAGFEGEGILGKLRDKLVPEKRTRSRSSSSSGASGNGNAVSAMIAFASHLDSLNIPYGPAGHGSTAISSAEDCSSTVSKVLLAGGVPLGGVLDTTRLPGAPGLLSGPGKAVTVYDRALAGDAGHTIISLRGRFFGTSRSNPGGGPGWLGPQPSSYLATLPTRLHPRGMRSGGRVGAGAVRKAAGAGPSRSNAQAFMGVLERFGSSIDHAMISRLYNVRGQLQKLAKGTDGKTLERMRGAISVVDHELGERARRFVNHATRLATSTETRSTHVDRRLRRRGVDSASLAGVIATRQMEHANEATLRAGVEQLKHARKLARRAGDKGALREIGKQMDELRDSIAESATRQIELYRDKVNARAQKRVDKATFGVDVAQQGLSYLDAVGGGDTAAGMTKRANAITSGLVPALTRQIAAYAKQGAAARKIGDTAGANQAYLAWLQATTDMTAAMSEAGDLMRQAAEATAQAAVDAAAHGAAMADAGLQHLELEQRISGTFEAGGQARADYIANTIRPALEAELAALQRQQQTALNEGDKTLADQIAEAIAGKQNDILQSQLDAMEQVASNTEPRRFGGTLGFSAGGDTLTDLLVLQGNGA